MVEGPFPSAFKNRKRTSGGVPLTAQNPQLTCNQHVTDPRPSRRRVGATPHGLARTAMRRLARESWCVTKIGKGQKNQPPFPERVAWTVNHRSDDPLAFRHRGSLTVARAVPIGTPTMKDPDIRVLFPRLVEEPVAVRRAHVARAGTRDVSSSFPRTQIGGRWWIWRAPRRFGGLFHTVCPYESQKASR